MLPQGSPAGTAVRAAIESVRQSLVSLQQAVDSAASERSQLAAQTEMLPSMRAQLQGCVSAVGRLQHQVTTQEQQYADLHVQFRTDWQSCGTRERCRPWLAHQEQRRNLSRQGARLGVRRWESQPCLQPLLTVWHSRQPQRQLVSGHVGPQLLGLQRHQQVQ